MSDPNTSPIEAACMTLQQLKEINQHLASILAWQDEMADVILGIARNAGKLAREHHKPAIAADTPKRVAAETFAGRKKVKP